MKASNSKEVKIFTDIPNIGPAMMKDFKLIGIADPQDLKKKDPFDLYQRLCTITCKRHDPCVLDTFMAAVDFMNGNAARPWWHYTAKRKKLFPKL